MKSSSKVRFFDLLILEPFDEEDEAETENCSQVPHRSQENQVWASKGKVERKATLLLLSRAKCTSFGPKVPEAVEDGSDAVLVRVPVGSGDVVALVAGLNEGVARLRDGRAHVVLVYKERKMHLRNFSSCSPRR